MTDIFISYSHEDRGAARRFAEALQAEGLSVWWDEALRSGEAFDERIEQALKAAKAVVVLWSKHSVASRWVRAEATLADRNRTLVPVMIGPCERPIMFELTHSLEMSHWAGDLADEAWLNFVSELRILASEDRASAPVSAPIAHLEGARPPAGERGEAPSLAVLPFTNRSGAAEDEVFAEGMVEDVVAALSQGVNVRVLGSMTTAGLKKGTFTDIAAIGRQLGVRYLLEGNVRRAGVGPRVTTQLLEAASGAVLWAAKFDRPLAELAELQEELVLDVAASLDAKVYNLEMERALKKPSDITAWEAMMRAWSAYRGFDPVALRRGVEEATRAVSVAPDYAAAQAMLALTLSAQHAGAGLDDPAAVQRIHGMTTRALELDPEDTAVLNNAAHALCMIGRPQEALRHITRALAKTPGDGMAHYVRGLACSMLNRNAETLEALATASRLMPGHPILWAVRLFEGYAQLQSGRLAEADGSIRESLALNPEFPYPWMVRAVIGRRDGRGGEARELMAAVRRNGPLLAQAERYFRLVFANSPMLDGLLADLRAAWDETEPPP